MYKLKAPAIHASEIAGLINQELVGNDIIVTKPCTLKTLSGNSFICLLKEDQYDIERLAQIPELLVISNLDFDASVRFSYIKSPSPKLDFIKTVNEFFIIWEEITIASSAKIHPNAKIGRNVSIGENVFIGPDVTIGDNTHILNNAVITNQVMIGKDCIIKHNSTIGSEGFDFEIDKLGIPIHYPHIGKIIIGNNVWIGSNTSVESGKINDTIIHNDVKIDDLVQIGYNCEIGERTMITAGVIVSRDVRIGTDCLLAPNATIRNNVTIGDSVTIGQGAVILKDAEAHAVYIGNPGKLLKKNS